MAGGARARQGIWSTRRSESAARDTNQALFRRDALSAGAEEFVGDVEGGNRAGHPDDVRARNLPRGQPHLLVDVGRQLADILRVEVAPNSVLLPVDVDVDHAGVRHRLRLSMWAIIWVTRNRIRSRSSRRVARFGRRAGRFAQARAHRVDFTREPGRFVDRLRALRAKRVDHRHQLPDFVFGPESIGCRSVAVPVRAMRHSDWGLAAPRTTAPCARVTAATIWSTPRCTSPSVNVRRAARNRSRRQADRAGRHALSLIAVEFGHAHERRRRDGPNRRTNVGGWQGVGDEDREIPHDRREPREAGIVTAGDSPD